MRLGGTAWEGAILLLLFLSPTKLGGGEPLSSNLADRGEEKRGNDAPPPGAFALGFAVRVRVRGRPRWFPFQFCA